MNKINWSNYNGESFQAFCNDILDFELGVNYVPFNAPGSDGGIDGLFEGQYGNYVGKWRVQAKFCAPETGRQENINRLGKEIKSELNKFSKGESNHFIFITNVEVGPKQLNKLLLISDEVISELNIPLKVHVWDDAKIATILSHHPILMSKYIEGYDSELIEYRDYFSNQLSKKVELVNQMGNTFYFRDEKISQLNEFLGDETYRVACISGDAGMGKTRLAVEFFDQLRNSKSNWLPLVLSATDFDSVRLQRNLRGKRDYVVLLDDVDRFQSQALEGLLELTNQLQNRIKFIFTIRLSLFDSFVHSLSSRNTNRILQISLEKFTPEETWTVLTTELNNFRLEQFKISFLQLTNGVPIVIILLIDTVRNLKNPDSIKDDDFLRLYVFEHFKKIARVAKKEFGIEKHHFDKFLNIYTLIEPINIDDDQTLELIAQIEGIDIEQVGDLFQFLDKEKVIIGRGLKLIKPDLYSDYILSKALSKRGWLKKKLTDYDTFIHNIAINLGYLYHQKSANIQGVINSILKEYVDQIDSVSSSKQLAQILDVTRFLSNVQEEHSISALKKVLLIYTNNNHHLNQQLRSYLGERSYSAYLPFVRDIYGIIRSLFHSENNWKSAIKFSEEFYGLIGDEEFVNNLSRFGSEDYYNGFNCKFQSRIPIWIQEFLDENGTVEIFHFKLLKALLKLELMETSGDVVKRNSLIIRTIHVQDTNEVRSLRLKVIDLLIEVFNSKMTNDELRRNIFHLIKDIPREIMSVKKKTKFVGVELPKVLDFIHQVSLSNYLQLKERHELKETIYWYIQWGIDKKYHAKIDTIKMQLDDNTLTDKLMSLLNPNSKYFEEKETINSDVQEVINTNDPVEIASSMIQVLEQSDNYPNYLQQFNNVLSRNQSYMIEFVETIWERRKELLFTHFTALFGSLRFSIDGELKYWDYMSRFEKINHSASRNAILNIYSAGYLDTYYGGDNPGLINKDVELLQRVIGSSDETNYYSLSRTLPTLLLVDRDLAKKEILNFLSKCTDNHLDYLFHSFERFGSTHHDFVSDILINETIKFNLSYHLEQLIAKQINEIGLTEVLKYFEKRFLHWRELVKKFKHSNGYEFVPNRNNGVLINGIDSERSVSIFKDVLKWFLTIRLEPNESYWAIGMIEAFIPDTELNAQFTKIFWETARVYESNFEKFLLLIDVLKLFKQKNSDYLRLILSMVRLSDEQPFNNEQKQEILDQLFFASISVGLKTGTSGQPFQVDIELRDLVTSILRNNESRTEKEESLLNRVLGSIERDIERNSHEENEIW